MDTLTAGLQTAQLSMPPKQIRRVDQVAEQDIRH